MNGRTFDSRRGGQARTANDHAVLAQDDRLKMRRRGATQEAAEKSKNRFLAD
jgi:hypothetical protein